MKSPALSQHPHPTRRRVPTSPPIAPTRFTHQIGTDNWGYETDTTPADRHGPIPNPKSWGPPEAPMNTHQHTHKEAKENNMPNPPPLHVKDPDGRPLIKPHYATIHGARLGETPKAPWPTTDRVAAYTNPWATQPKRHPTSEIKLTLCCGVCLCVCPGACLLEPWLAAINLTLCKVTAAGAQRSLDTAPSVPNAHCTAHLRRCSFALLVSV